MSHPGLHVSRTGRKWHRDNRGYPTGYVPGTSVSLLSRPEKMPGASWALPAGPACPFMVVGEDTICGSCYANVGRYRDDTHTRAMWARFDWVRECMKTPEGVDRFVDTMVRAIDGTRRLWFRIHDSGDFFSERYARAWHRICSALSWVHFWGPTRSWRAPWLDALVELNALPNVAIRPSALHFDVPPPMIQGLAAGTSVSVDAWDCPAARNGGRCGDCRRCWVDKSQPTIYHRLRGSSKKARPRPIELLRLAGALP